MKASRDSDQGKITRRQLFPLAGKATLGAAGLAAMASTGLGLGCGQQEQVENQGGCEPHPWPWPYEKLDERRVAEIAYENWYQKFCCYAVASSILLQLQEKIGEPYTTFPIESTKWGHGGAVGWGTLCGTLTAVGITTGLIAGEDGEHILNDVINWYTVTELPTYTPASPRLSVSNLSTSSSPLCHISVGKWMEKEGVAFFSPARQERCARLSANVAMKTVELLNQWSEGKYVAGSPEQAKANQVQMASQNNCTECHAGTAPSSPGI
jgi:hypothetical protein